MAKKQVKPKRVDQKAVRKEARISRRRDNVQEIAPGVAPELDERIHTRELVCKNKAQKQFLQLLESQSIVFGTGPAGTGKTFVATKFAAQQLDKRKIQRIIITRPAVNADEEMGALPGEISDKWAPYFKPVRKVLERHFGIGAVECMLKNGRIEIAPLAFLRGDTFEDAFVIFDEAQNATVEQMKLFLTRIGPNTTVMIDGDVEQIDIKKPSGLVDALARFKDMPGSGMFEFTENDIVRHPLIKEIILRYRKPLPTS